MYNRNIYEIFEERKMDIFYQENFAFDDLIELDMILENIEKYILDDNEVIMENGLTDEERQEKWNKIHKLMDKNVQNNQDKITFRDKLNKKIKEIIGLINRFIQDVISKLYSKHEPLKKHINQVGESKIIEKLKGRRVRMPKIDNCDTVYELMTNRFDNCIKSLKNYNGGKYNISQKALIMDYNDKIEGELTEKDIKIYI